MGRYVQRVSLVPFRAEEIWIGWELEGVEGEVDGLYWLESLSQEQQERMAALEWQPIPSEYLDGFTRSLA